jgi:hypothetical protein
MKAGNLCFLTMRTFLFCCIILLAVPAMAQNSKPVFINGPVQSMTICENSTVTSINGLMQIMDADTGQAEVWTVTAMPMHGVLGGFPATATSTGDTILLTGLTYVPVSGFFGLDTFMVQISDGIDSTADTVIVDVKPTPSLASALNPDAICDGAVFNYTPVSLTPGTSFNWSRDFVSGIANLPASDTGNPFETLVNTTFFDVPVTYIYTLTAGSCSSIENVNVTVHPTPRLSSETSATVCSGAIFNYAPTGFTAGTTFTWERLAVAGISPASSTGIGGISEGLVNTTPVPVNTIYTFALTANGCTAARNVVVTVNAPLAITRIVSKPGTALCAGSMYQNFGASMAAPAGISYTWTATNAAIYAVAGNGQNVLVNFNTPGNSVVTLTFTDQATGCTGKDTAAVTVSAGNRVAASVLYYNNEFIYTDNTVESYQWGYDNTATLDSTVIPGASFQSYPTSSPDFIHNYYWVITGKAGCSLKTYFNAPAAVTNINGGKTAAITVYPNPANNIISLHVDMPYSNAYTIVLTDVSGHTIQTAEGNGNLVQMNVAALPSGCYFVHCLQDGMRVGSSKFIKQ